MWFWLYIAVLALNFASLLTEENSDIEYDESKTEIMNKINAALGKKYLKSINYNNECQKRDWFCSKPCNWNNEDLIGTCKQSDYKDNCFGLSVNYNYTRDFVHNFPEHLRIFEKFPSCWEALNPLICSFYFRPCGEFKVEWNKEKDAELWQIYPQHTCVETQNKCKFLIDAGIWPSQLQCNRSESSLKITETAKSAMINRRILFDDTGECKINFDKLDVIPSSGCMSPLVEINLDDTLNEIKSIIDRCYMPCSSSFVKEPKKLAIFRSSLLIFTIPMAIVFLGFAMYFALCLNFDKDQYFVFMLKWMFASISLFFIIWSYSLLTPTQGSCTTVGSSTNHIRRDNTKTRLNWCTIQWFSLNVLLISAFEWLTVLIYHLFIRGGNRGYEFLTKYEWNSPSNFRILLAFFIFALAFIVSLLGVGMREEFPDGLTNVCYGPLEPIESNIVLYLILFILSTISIGCLFEVVRKCWKARKFETFTDRQQKQTLLQSNPQENCATNGQEIENLVDVERQDLIEIEEIENYRSIAFKSSLFIIAGVVFSIAIMVFLNYNFKFNAYNEKLAIENKIKCIIDYSRELNKKKEASNGTIPEFCTIDEIHYIDLILIFIYAILMPSLPFIFVLFAIIFGKFSKSYGLWEAYQSVTQLLNKNNTEEKHKESNCAQPASTMTHKSVDASTNFSKARTEPLPHERKHKRRRKRRFVQKRIPTSESRSIDVSKRNQGPEQYIPPYIIRDNLVQNNNLKDGIPSNQLLNNSFQQAHQYIQTGFAYLCWAVQIIQQNQGQFSNEQQTNLKQLMQILQPFINQQNQVQQPFINQQNQIQPSIDVQINQIQPPSIDVQINEVQPPLIDQQEESNNTDDNIESSDEKGTNSMTDSNYFDSDESNSSEERLFNGEQPNSSKSNSITTSSVNSEANVSTTSKWDSKNPPVKENEDEIYPGFSPLLHQITKHAQNVQIGDRMIFAQRALTNFRDLFEKDEKFITICKAQRRIEPLNPETGTLDGMHLVSVPEVIELASKLQKNVEICHAGMLCGKAIKQATESMKSPDLQ